jgi:surface carbohydrate biosynthesis protein
MLNNILLPIEQIGREFDYKLLLASMCSEDDLIFIGQHDYLYFISKFMTGGSYIGKNLFSIREDGTWKSRHTELKKRGFSIIYLDEEGAVYWGEADTWRRRLNKRINISEIDKDDYICAWGSFQKSHYQNVTKALDSNIVITGHPRFDLFKPKYFHLYKDDVNKIQSKYGEFILIPTAFAWFNNSQGHKDSFSKRWSFSYEDTLEAKKEQIGNWSYSGRTFCSYIEMILDLSSEFPEINIVVRPHPSEDMSAYKHAFNGINNVFIISEGGITSWILACKILIQDGCTTAVEGHIANKPTFSYQPNFDEKYDMFLPSVTSIKTKTISEIIDLTKKVFNQNDLNKDLNENLKQNKVALSLMENLSQSRKSDSFDNIISVLKKAIDSRKNNKSDKFNRFSFLCFRIKYNFITKSKNLLRPFFKEKYATYKAIQNIFPGFNKYDVLSKINKIEKIENSKIKIHFANKNLIIISKVS